MGKDTYFLGMLENHVVEDGPDDAGVVFHVWGGGAAHRPSRSSNSSMRGGHREGWWGHSYIFPSLSRLSQLVDGGAGRDTCKDRDTTFNMQPNRGLHRPPGNLFHTRQARSAAGRRQRELQSTASSPCVKNESRTRCWRGAGRRQVSTGGSSSNLSRGGGGVEGKIRRMWGSAGKSCVKGWLLATVLLACLAGPAAGVGNLAGGACTGALIDDANVFGVSKGCGASVVNSVSGPLMVGTVTIKVATSTLVPKDATFEITFPLGRGDYTFNFPDSSKLSPFLVPFGTSRSQMSHGTGEPSLSFAGNKMLITLGGFGSPTQADSEGGFHFAVTNIRNPYPNNGTAHGFLGVRLLSKAGAQLDAVNLSAPVISVGDIDGYNATIALTPNSAGVPANVLLSFTTAGYIPPGGRMLLTFPDGFVATNGSSVCVDQRALGGTMTLWVNYVSPAARTVSLALIPELGKANAWMPPVIGGSVVVTNIRNPPSGVTGTFKLETMNAAGDIIDVADAISGVLIVPGLLRDVQVGVVGENARQPAVYSFVVSTTGAIPGDGKFVLSFPFGYYLEKVQLLSFNGFGATGVPTVSFAGRDISIQLGGTFLGPQLDPTEGVTFTLSGIINPGAGAGSNTYYVRSTFSNPNRIVDQAEIKSIDIITGMFLARSVSLSQRIAGKATNVTVLVSTVGYIPRNAIIQVTFPAGVQNSLPVPTKVISSTCCLPTFCYNCNASVVSIQGTNVFAQIQGDGLLNFPDESNITITFTSVRCLWAGAKDGFDISLLLSDMVSNVLQAKDVDGPVIEPGIFSSVDIQFSETPSLSLTYKPPIAGRCGGYRFLIHLSGLLPTNAKIEVTFPPTISLNEPTCDFDTRYPEPISRLTHERVPFTLIDYTIDSGTRKVVISTANTGSETWPTPGYLEFYITNVRHTKETALQPFVIRAFLPDGVSLVEQLLSIPVAPVHAENSTDVIIVPTSYAAGVRASVDVSVRLQGRLPRTGVIKVQLPNSFRLSDGEDSTILQSDLPGEVPKLPVTMSIHALDPNSGTAWVRIARDIGEPDGIANSTVICPTGGLPSMCQRTPPAVTPGALLLERQQITFTLSQIRNLAGGQTGKFALDALLADAASLVETNTAVPGVNLTIGLLADATVTPKLLGSAIRTTFYFQLSVSNTLQTNGNVILQFPPGFKINDGGKTNVTGVTFVRFAVETSTPATIFSSDEAKRQVIVNLGGREDDFLGAFNLVRFTLTNIRNMVARPPAGSPVGTGEKSGPFGVSTTLASMALVETFSIPGVTITPNTIVSYPVGRARVILDSLAPSTVTTLRIQYSSDSVLPENGVVEVSFPTSYTFNSGGTSVASVTYDGGSDPTATTTITLLPTGVKVRAARNGTFAVAPQVLVQLAVGFVRTPAAIGGTGVYNISVLTPDDATISRGQLLETVIGRPSEPENLVVSNCQVDWPLEDLRCINVSWSPPRDDGGSPVVSYKVVFDNTDVTFLRIVNSVFVAGNVYTVTSEKTLQLQEGVEHFVRVEAITMGGGFEGFGAGGYAGPIRVISLPSRPRAATFRAHSTNRVFVSWFPPQFTGAINPAAPITRYRVDFASDVNFTTINPANSLFATGNDRNAISALLPPGRYYARVAAGNAVGYGPPASYALTALASPLVPVAWDTAITPPQGAILPVLVGYWFAYTVRAFDADVTDTISLFVTEDVGIPQRASVSAAEISGINDGVANVATRTYNITADRTQAGTRFESCFSATNANANPLGVPITITTCTIVSVMLPEMAWFTSLVAGDGLTPEEGSRYALYPGCVTSVPISATAVWYKVDFGYEAYVVEFDGSEVPIASLDGVTIETRQNPPGQPGPGNYTGTPNNYTWSAVLNYQPRAGQAGSNNKVCITATDEWGMATIRRCVFLETGTCKACLRSGQTLSSLAAEYDTDWLQIWATNPRMGNPDVIQIGKDAKLINIGVMYKARAGETPGSLAARTFWSVEKMISYNPQLTKAGTTVEQAKVRPFIEGQRLCMIPPVCGLLCPGDGKCFRQPKSKNAGFVA